MDNKKILTPQEFKQRQEEEDRQALRDYLNSHQGPVISSEDLRECGPEIAEFEAMLVVFESAHSLTDLHSIVDLTPEESRMHPIREPARLALIPIVKKMNILKKETNISSEKYEELKAVYMRFLRAVGMINKDNKVDHNG
jgi:hypothetical protein